MQAQLRRNRKVNEAEANQRQAEADDEIENCFHSLVNFSSSPSMKAPPKTTAASTFPAAREFAPKANLPLEQKRVHLIACWLYP